MKNTDILLASSKRLPPTSQTSSSHSTSSYVCFACRTRRSLPRFNKDHALELFQIDVNSHRPACHSCKQQMQHVGPKMEIPPQGNVRGWEIFYDYITRPYQADTYNYCAEIDPVRDEENQHWWACNLRRKGGCTRCERVEERMPDFDKLSANWNSAVY